MRGVEERKRGRERMAGEKRGGHVASCGMNSWKLACSGATQSFMSISKF